MSALIHVTGGGRAGCAWAAGESARVLDSFHSGMEFWRIAQYHQRSTRSIAMHLQSKGITNATIEEYAQVQSTNEVKENTVATENKELVLEQKTFLNGRDIETYSDDDLFRLIKSLETAAKEWDGLEHKPKALTERLKRLDQNLMALVAFMDKRAGE